MNTNNQNKIKAESEKKVTIRVPLEISIDLGLPELIENSVYVREPSELSSTLLVNKFTDVSKLNESNNRLLESALVKLEASRTADYYSETEDLLNRDAYYQTINRTLSAKDLFLQLSELIKQTHRNKLKYKPAVHLYPDVDLQPDRTIHSIYSGIEYSPERLIEEDFQIDQQRGMQLRQTILKEDSWGAEMFAQELDLIENALPYNCEHVVPQSWFGKREPMRGDLHHLFACEMNCNSFRGNIPYFDFVDFNETTTGKCGKRDGNKFEPAGGKGPVSRAVLYFLLRYPGEINQTNNEYTEDRLSVLLDWHENFPPEIYEKHRNAFIFSKQGNRNPFIDFPEFSEQVDFRLGLG